MPIDQYEPVAHIALRTPESIAAYANPTRMTLLAILAGEECTLSVLASKLKTTPANLSHHIRKLLEARLIMLVETRATARNVEKYYRASARSYSVEQGQGASANNLHLDAEASFQRDIAAAFARRESAVSAARGGQAAPGPASFAKLVAARLRPEDAADFSARLGELAREFSAKDDGSGGDYSLALALCPNDFVK